MDETSASSSATFLAISAMMVNVVMDMICTVFSFQNLYTFPLTQLSQNTACCSTLLSVEPLSSVFWRKKLCDIYSSIGCALSSFRSPLGPPFDFLFDTCSCQTARCFNKSKGVLITGSKLKAFRNPQPSWGFSVHKQAQDGGNDPASCSIAQNTAYRGYSLSEDNKDTYIIHLRLRILHCFPEDLNFHG